MNCICYVLTKNVYKELKNKEMYMKMYIITKIVMDKENETAY